MIDKRIYYCWFGHGEMSDLDKKCIASWKKQCPDYEIIEINETNYDWESNPYAKMHYEAGNWSGVSNAARLDYLIKNNGFYLDTDVMLFKSLDSLRGYDKGFITEFDAGQPDSGVLGRGDTCPNVYKEAYERLVPGTVLHKEFIQILYRDYDIHGESFHEYDDGFVVLGEAYFPSYRTGLFTESTVGLHFFENTWVKTAPKAADDFYPYIKVIAKLGNKVINRDPGAYVNLIVKHHSMKVYSPKILLRMNYFFNPNVIKLSCAEFEAERIDYDKLAPVHHQVTASNMIVSYI